jgi:ketosteroid isomerase-like protein
MVIRPFPWHGRSLKPYALAACAPAALAFAGCHPTSPGTRQQDVETIRHLDAQWSKTAGAHDLEATVSFYADNAVLLPPDEAVAADKAAIRKSWAAALQAFETLSWEPTKIEIAQAADLAYLTGRWQGRLKTPGGFTAVTASFGEVWKKQPDGNWKCVADTYNSDAPATPGARRRP